ncbi:pseudouridine synthase [Longitalea luteola]|uniref:pseudouridine synthase n=1 Tax=Longitalea luteola TaxID=2812563 RepID=UPI001F62057B|nr:pseudouridine synthase [Longitalea luteola]
MAQGFKKFMDKGDSGAKKKERIRQEKKKVRQETKEYFEKKKQEAREARAQGQAGGYQSERGRKDFKQGIEKGNEAKRHKGIEKGSERTEYQKPKAKFGKAEGARTKPQTTNNKPQTGIRAAAQGKGQVGENQPATGNRQPVTGSMPLNKFIAHAGICSRRDAADLVKAGKVIVNGEKIIEPGHKVTDKDDIKVNGKKLFIRRNLVYILINKPKDYITTTEDPQGRKTVLDIIRNATEERVYPIGRLDRNTTGVLLLTNDGELAQKLSHPSYEIKKIYEVKLDKPLIKKDFDTIVNGITLEDGFIAPDSLAYADPKDKSVIGIEIHSGRNRIVRRIFEHMGYDVRNLDRVMYANLTKKNVDRGKWRFLTEKEVRLLKYLNASYTKNKTVTRG